MVCLPDPYPTISLIKRLATRMNITKADFYSTLDNLEGDLVDTLRTKWRRTTNMTPGQIEAILGNFEGLSSDVIALIDDTVDKEDVERLLERIRERVATAFPAAVLPDVEKSIALAYAHGRTKVPGANLPRLVMGGPDRAIQRAMATNEMYWVRNHYDRKLGKQIRDIVDETVFGKGLGRKEAGQALSEALKEPLGQSESYWGLVGSSVITRAGVYGSINTFAEANIEKYQIISMRLRNTCEFCLEMDGRVFLVKDALKRVSAYQKAKTPEEAKAADPWLDSATQKKMFGRPSSFFSRRKNELPQYHGHCQCVIGLVSDPIPIAPGAEMDSETAKYAKNLTPEEWGSKATNLSPSRYDPGRLSEDWAENSGAENWADKFIDKAGDRNVNLYAGDARTAAAGASDLFFKVEDGNPSFIFVNRERGTLTRGNGSFVWGHESISDLQKRLDELDRTAIRINSK